MMIKTLLVIAPLLFGLVARCQGDLIVQYNFDNDATHQDADVLDANLSETGPTSPVFAPFVTSESNLFAAEGQGLADGTLDDIADAFASGQYWEFTVDANVGFTFDLDTLTFDVSRANNGANDYAIRTSVDGFVSNLVYQNQAINNAAATQTVNFNTPGDFSGLTGTNVGGNFFIADQFDRLSTITFRIAYDDRQSNNFNSSATRLDNLALNGTVIGVVSGVPEPSSLSLVVLGMVGLLASRRRKP